MGKRKKSIPVTRKGGANLNEKTSNKAPANNKATNAPQDNQSSETGAGLRPILKKVCTEKPTKRLKVSKGALAGPTVVPDKCESGDEKDDSDSDEDLSVKEKRLYSKIEEGNDEEDISSESENETDNGDSDEELFVKVKNLDDGEEEEAVNSDNDVKENIEEAGSGSEIQDENWTDASDSDLDESVDESKENEGSAKLDEDELSELSESEDDEITSAIKKAKETKVREYPFPIKLEVEASDVSFHPTEEVIAIGDMDGRVLIYKYSNDENQLLYTLKKHARKCIRSLEFSDDGSYLISACSGRRIVIVDSATAKTKSKLKDAHESGVYCIKSIDENLFASGDDDGIIKLWDVREKPCNTVATWKEMDEFVTSMVVAEDRRTLIATSGEGTVTSFNLRQRKMKLQSEVYESEFNCLGFVRDGSKLVTGSNDGMVYIFNKDEYGFQSDTFGDHPEAVNALIPITESVVATACEDGFIRAMNVFPHRFLGVIGSHERTSHRLKGYPIERLDVSSCGHYLASVSHDKQVKFWNISYFEDISVPKGEKSARNKKKSNRKNRQDYHLPSSNMKNLSDFFEDLEEK